MGLSYSSVKFIKVHNTKLALIYYTLTLGIVVYVILYQIILNKGYQEYDPLSGTISLKTKGSAHALDADGRSVVFDATDLVKPAIEQDALFIGTALTKTHGQRRGVCHGTASDEICPRTGCKAGDFLTNGVATGNCIVNATGSGVDYCELQAWCPVEDDKNTHRMDLEGVKDWTILTKVNVFFPSNNVSLTNAEGDAPTRGLNLFSLDDIISKAGWSYDSVKHTGAIFLVNIEYDCDFNKAVSKCHPEFSFNRIDLSATQKIFSPGFNYRYVTQYTENGEQVRDLTKAVGIRVVFSVFGQAGKFSAIPLLVALGAGLGLLSVSTLICDFVLQYLLPQKEKYTNEKFQAVTEQDSINNQFLDHFLGQSHQQNFVDDDQN